MPASVFEDCCLAVEEALNSVYRQGRAADRAERPHDRQQHQHDVHAPPRPGAPARATARPPRAPPLPSTIAATSRQPSAASREHDRPAAQKSRRGAMRRASPANHRPLTTDG